MKFKKYIFVLAFALLVNCIPNMAYADELGYSEAEISFLPGALTFAEMSNFSFGSHTISSELKVYPAQESSVFIDVNDLRGTGIGWKVTALASEFNSGVSPTLPGAYIGFLNGIATSAQTVGNTPAVSQNIRLECDGEATTNIASAAEGAGLALWSIGWNGAEFDNQNATLSIPGSVATAGTHKVTITWSLAFAP